MLRKSGLWLWCCLLITMTALANDPADKDDLAAWQRLKEKPVTESNFQAACDLFQGIAKTNINLSYQLLAEYLPMVRKTGNRTWVHVLLMGWAKAKESLTAFADAEDLYRQARENAAGIPRFYDEALVGTVLLYAEWGRLDSLDKYSVLGKKAAEQAGDKENLSFIYTFGSIAYLTDTAAMGRSLIYAISLAKDLPDKNALFTARYNFATIYSQKDPQRQVMELDSLLLLCKDSTLTHKPKLYQRTAFTFRNPIPSIYMQMMQVNLLLADYDNAWKFGELLYDAVVKPNPSAPQAPYFNTELAIVKAYQQDYEAAKDLLHKSLSLFNVPEEKVAYPSYFLAAGMVAEHEQHYDKASQDYETAYKMGAMEGIHLTPSAVYYAHGLILLHRLADAEKVLTGLQPALAVRKYTAYGFYYYKYYAELLKAKGDYPAYAQALETYHMIGDSLANFNHYRAIQEIETRVRLRDKEQQITRLNEENEEKLRNIRQQRIFFTILLGLGLLLLLLLIAYARTQRLKREKQHRIEVMEGAMDAEENERHKIADQLHDEVGSLLSLASLNVSSTLEHGKEDPHGKEKLEKTGEILHSVSGTIRELSHRLTPLVIEKYGFKKAVEDLAYTVNLAQKLQLDLVIVGFEDPLPYPPSFLNHLYRTLQELLQNILKHARATEALIQLVEHREAKGNDPAQVSIVVEDNGIGITEQEMEKGKGLRSIQSKIAYLNGRIEISRKIDGGTLIVIEIPGHL